MIEEYIAALQSGNYEVSDDNDVPYMFTTDKFTVWLQQNTLDAANLLTTYSEVHYPNARGFGNVVIKDKTTGEIHYCSIIDVVRDLLVEGTGVSKPRFHNTFNYNKPNKHALAMTDIMVAMFAYNGLMARAVVKNDGTVIIPVGEYVGACVISKNGTLSHFVPVPVVDRLVFSKVVGYVSPSVLRFFTKNLTLSSGVEVKYSFIENFLYKLSPISNY